MKKAFNTKMLKVSIPFNVILAVDNRLYVKKTTFKKDANKFLKWIVVLINEMFPAILYKIIVLMNIVSMSIS